MRLPDINRLRSLAIAAVSILALAEASGGASAASVTGAVTPTVALSCHISQGKVIVITNSTTATIAAGTKITYDAIRTPDGAHYGKTIGGPLLPPGASFQMGAQQSSSCTAWYHRPLLMRPS